MCNATRYGDGGTLPDAGATGMAGTGWRTNDLYGGAPSTCKPSAIAEPQKYYPGTKGENAYEPLEPRKQMLDRESDYQEGAPKRAVAMENPDGMKKNLLERMADLNGIIESLQNRLQLAVTERDMVTAGLESYNESNSAQKSCDSVPSRFDG